MTGRLVLAYARRYEPQHLVDELLQNAGWADEVVCLDQRRRKADVWSPRDERVAALTRRAKRTGADWCMILDPDERLQDGAEAIIRATLAEHPDSTRFSLALREMWTPTQYRCDGVWADRWRRRIFHLRRPTAGPRVKVDCELAHLKMIDPANRQARSEVHAALNTWDNRVRGFAYMLDEDGLELAEARPYSPEYAPYRFTVPGVAGEPA